MAKEVVSNTNNCGVFAVVMAVLSILFPVSALPFGVIGGLVCAILGLIFGIVQVRKANNPWAVWAIVLSIIGIIVNVVVILMMVAAINAMVAQYQQVQQSGLIDNVKNAASLSQQYGGAVNA